MPLISILINSVMLGNYTLTFTKIFFLIKGGYLQLRTYFKKNIYNYYNEIFQTHN